MVVLTVFIVCRRTYKGRPVSRALWCRRQQRAEGRSRIWTVSELHRDWIETTGIAQDKRVASKDPFYPQRIPILCVNFGEIGRPMRDTLQDVSGSRSMEFSHDPDALQGVSFLQSWETRLPLGSKSARSVKRCGRQQRRCLWD